MTNGRYKNRINWRRLVDNKTDAEIFAKPEERKRDPNPEWKIQAACVKVLRERQKFDSGLRFIANMAEGQRDVKRAAIAKMMGLSVGVCDILVLRKKAGKVQIDWCELKRPGGRMSEAQIDWRDWFADTDVKTHCIFSLDEFVNKVLDAA